MLYCVHSATTFFIFSIYAFISLFTCLFCLPICDFDLSFYMYVCMNIYTKWKTYLEFHNEFFFFFWLYFAPLDPKFWLRPWLLGSIGRSQTLERFYAEYFGFLFDNTSACYLVFAFFFPTLLAFILLLCFDEYGLE